ncbi:MAG: aspartyl-tRNA amidotransferase [Candidatus Nealsonbacteria bacterium CG10_big_fil_rev_8_21_14_0_10_36_24]|uniref:Aspartyl-tRNA amidotransferase n=2 Tax=Candidatus Nealsoniibacteriota TaxID=1817911 RepID=A0A2H0YNT0_9BACT|nr:MAG: aspartyl-tRNA amidotransferase [Candidatus Nealsonbacteria bacterium CG10_big_fil_rev_8_21_14_0_10_36_24]PIS40120.1 MAG: aspartyl-tRNA amidotransferase [Candidatus Nealsonbacteria bacterium CG08_land_8_20_14_0_20_36_22]
MLKQTIQKDLFQAVKEGDEITRSTLRLLLAGILNKEKEKKYKTSKEELTDEEIIEVIFSEAKKRKEAIIEYKRGGREDLSDKEKAELEVLQKYLPEQLSEEELKKITKEAIEKVRAKEVKDIGRVMAEIMPEVKGKADGSAVSKIVKELLVSKNE